MRVGCECMGIGALEDEAQERKSEGGLEKCRDGGFLGARGGTEETAITDSDIDILSR